MTNPYAELLAMGLNEEEIEAHFKQLNTVDNVERFKSITAEMAYIYARKNKDYGSAFDISLDEDGLLVAKIRLGDKMKRFTQLIKKGYEQKVKDESVRDTLIDMANYAVMTVMWMDLQQEVKKQKEMGKSVTAGPIDASQASVMTIWADTNPVSEIRDPLINPSRPISPEECINQVFTVGADLDGDIVKGRYVNIKENNFGIPVGHFPYVESVTQVQKPEAMQDEFQSKR